MFLRRKMPESEPLQHSTAHNPEIFFEIPLSRGQVAKVSAEDYARPFHLISALFASFPRLNGHNQGCKAEEDPERAVLQHRSSVATRAWPSTLRRPSRPSADGVP